MTPAKAGRVADVLFRAADRVQFEGWTQYTYARDPLTTPVRVDDPDAALWCAQGALKSVACSSRQSSNAIDALRDYLGVPSIMLWNDMSHRTAGEVADAMRRCAKGLLEAAQP